MIKKILEYKWTLLILFGVVLLANYLTMSGVLGNLTQREVSDKYVNLFAPKSITFSIWSIIYIGVGMIIYSEFKNSKNEAYIRKFNSFIKPTMIGWMIANIVWNIFWVNERLWFSLIMILIYFVVLAIMNMFIVKDDDLYNEWLFLRLPSGLHLGWIIVATFANLMSAIASTGLNVLGTVGIFLTLFFIVMVLILAVIFSVSNSNWIVMIAPLWGIAGIVLNHMENSDFIHKNQIVLYGSIALLGIGVFVLIAMVFRRDTARYQ